MNKIKNFFFNKIEKNKPTSFSELITSFVLGGVKIFILLMLNGIVNLFFRIDSEYDTILILFQFL